MKIAVVVVAALGLAGCEPPPKPEVQLTPEQIRALPLSERCAFASKSLGNPWVSAEQKQVLIEAMRNAGCMGNSNGAPPPTVIVSQPAYNPVPAYTEPSPSTSPTYQANRNCSTYFGGRYTNTTCY